MKEGVWTAATTPFDSAGEVDLSAVERHVRFLRDAGCPGVIVLGSLGEASSLESVEKLALLEAARRGVDDPSELFAGVAATRTEDAVRFARQAESRGVGGLMVLPPYVYRGDWRETRTHLSHVLNATPLPVLLYNNPVAYGTDVVPSQVEELLVDHPNLVAVKDSSGDVRRFSELRARLGDRVKLFVGLDDQVLEATAAGAVGWVAGVANALPELCIELLARCRAGPSASAWALYRWFLPLLHLDAEAKFVQMIKLLQAETGTGSARVRPPRLELEGEELLRVKETIRSALRDRPVLEQR